MTTTAADADKIEELRLRRTARETRLRRMADRQGLRLEKSRQRDPYGLTYGCYRLLDPRRGPVEGVADPAGRGYPFENLDQIENWLTR